jgi:hypothetical protein
MVLHAPNAKDCLVNSEWTPQAENSRSIETDEGQAPPAYVHANSTQTLGEALTEYYECNANLLDPGGLPAEVAEMFRRHDAGHVVFGCDTSLRGEALIDTWTVVGTTAGIRGYLEYFKYPQVNQIFENTGYLTIMTESLRQLPDLFRVIASARRQTAKWPWNDYLSYVDRSLASIRSEFGIRLV